MADGRFAKPRLGERYPDVAYLLGAYLLGDDDLEMEIGELVATDGAERAELVLAELRALLLDQTVDDEELTTFVRTASPWLIQTGRITLQHVADQLAEILGRTAAG